MKSKKLSLANVKVSSFVTQIDGEGMKVMGGSNPCWCDVSRAGDQCVSGHPVECNSTGTTGNETGGGMMSGMPVCP